jgi:predicted ester cyclase
MTPEELRACGRRLVEELFNQGDLSVADQIIDPRYIEHMLSEQPAAVGVEGVKRFVTQVRRAFPDICCRIDDQIIEGDKLVQRLTVSGTHEGRPFLGVPGNGAPVTISLVEIFRLEIVPMVSALPGYVSGVWTRNRDLTGTDSIIVFDTEEQANVLLNYISAQDPAINDAGGVVLTEAHISLVVAKA